MTKKVRPNEPCPCGSGRKFKKCCNGPGAPAAAGGLPHTQADRASAFEKLDFFIDELLEEEEEAAFEAFWGRHDEHEGELPKDLLVMSQDVHEAWFAFDHEVEDGVRVIDEFLKQAVLSGSERSFLMASSLTSSTSSSRRAATKGSSLPSHGADTNPRCPPTS